MSKSLGNTVDPKKIAEEYSTDALRYFLIKEVSSFEDSPFTIERFKDAYNAGLANGLGNLASRILTLSEKYLETCPEITENNLPQEFFDHLEKYEIQKASDFVWKKIQELDERIQKDEPFKVVKVDLDKGKQIISEIVVDLYVVSEMLEPLLPETSKYLKEQIKLNQKPEKPLFLRV